MVLCGPSDETSQAKQTPSLVWKYQLCASERKDTKGADPKTEHGAKVSTVLGLALPVCACLLLVFCSLASVPGRAKCQEGLRLVNPVANGRQVSVECLDGLSLVCFRKRDKSPLCAKMA